MRSYRYARRSFLQGIGAGAVGINLEDTLRPIAEQAERIAAARRAADATGVLLNSSSASAYPRLGVGSFAAAYGTGLASSVVVATPPYPPSLGGVTVMVLVPLFPCMKVKLLGVADRPKLGTEAAFTVRLTVVV